MGRPSLTGKRTTEILEAFENCVARFGLEGSSLERIAEQAGMKRSILRHYIGNRADMTRALADHVISKFEAVFAQHLAANASASPVDQLLGFLFPEKPVESTQTLLAIEALIAAAEQDSVVGEKLKSWINGLTDQTASLLRQQFGAKRSVCWNVAWGIVCICFNQGSLAPLQLDQRYLRAAKHSTHALIHTLKPTVE